MILPPEGKKSLLRLLLTACGILAMCSSYGLMRFRVISEPAFLGILAVTLLILLLSEVLQWHHHRSLWSAGDRSPLARLSQYSGVLIFPMIGLLVRIIGYTLHKQNLISETTSLVLKSVVQVLIYIFLFVVVWLTVRDIKNAKPGEKP